MIESVRQLLQITLLHEGSLFQELPQVGTMSPNDVIRLIVVLISADLIECKGFPQNLSVEPKPSFAMQTTWKGRELLKALNRSSGSNLNSLGTEDDLLTLIAKSMQSLAMPEPQWGRNSTKRR